MKMLDDDDEEYKVGSPTDWHQTGKTVAAQKANDAAAKAKGVAKASSAMGGGSRLAQAISGSLAASKASNDAYTSGYDTGVALANQQESMKQRQAQWEKEQKLRQDQFKEGQRQFNENNALAKEQLKLSKDQLEEARKNRRTNMWMSLGKQAIDTTTSILGGMGILDLN